MVYEVLEKGSPTKHNGEAVLKRLYSKYLLCSTSWILICAHQAVAQNENPTLLPESTVPDLKTAPLSGNEVLVTYLERGGQTKTIALSITKDNSRLNKSRQVFRGSHKVTWAPNRERVTFYRSDYIWFADKNGQEVPFAPAPVQFKDSVRPPIYWDWNGVAYSFQEYPHFGSSMLRSTVLSLNMPLNRILHTDSVTTAFREEIIPTSSALANFPKTTEFDNAKVGTVPNKALQYYIYSIVNATFSIDGEYFVAQVAPNKPFGWGQLESQIFRFNILDKYPEKYRKNTAQIRERYEIGSGSIPSIDGVAEPLWPQSTESVDTNPQFSPKGNFLNFSRMDKNSKTIIPWVYNTAQKILEKVDVKEFSSINQVGEQTWGRPLIDILQWDRSAKDGAEAFWAISTSRDEVFRVERTNNKWILKDILGYRASDGAQITSISFSGDWIIWAGNRAEAGNVIFYNWKTKQELRHILPSGALVQWIS